MFIQVEVYPFLYPTAVRRQMEPYRTSFGLMNQIYEMEADLEKEKAFFSAWAFKKAQVVFWALGVGVFFLLLSRTSLHPSEVFPEWAKITWLFTWGFAQVIPWLAGFLIVIEGCILGLNGAIYVAKNRAIHRYLDNLGG